MECMRPVTSSCGASSEVIAPVRQGRIMIDLLLAGNDPLFMADVVEIQQAFEHADHEKAL
jgi:hypothetical protein